MSACIVLTTRKHTLESWYRAGRNLLLIVLPMRRLLVASKVRSQAEPLTL